MTQIIVIVLLAVALVLAILVIVWLKFSKSQKNLVNKAQKEAKIARKSILANGYREINELKLEFQRERDKRIHELDLEAIRIKGDLSLLEKEQALNKIKQQRLNALEVSLEKRGQEYDIKINNIIIALEEISGISSETARELLLETVKFKIRKETNSYIKNAELEAHNKAKELSNGIIISSMEKYATEIANDKTTNVIKLENDDLKGRIIGKDGRNIKVFEQSGGVDVVIDDTPGVVVISSFNPIRREIAKRTLEKLLIDGRIQPSKIESELKKQEENINEIILEEGTNVVKELEISNMDIELVKLVGKLKYRTSYGQSVLLHSVEVAKIAGSIAAELNLNVKDAIRAGLLHDIGKAVDFEQEGNHVILGVDVARKYGENDVVINAIESHHEDVAKETPIAAIVSIADSISASRPGARNNTVSEFFTRMKEIEKACNAIPGVDKAYALQSGRQIRVIVDPTTVNDEQMSETIERVKEAIENSAKIPGDTTITLIREKREVRIIR
ncbi:ribonuclease Y [Williamsoniiplasma somnilux]|uniref:Ribonuclease Y n=1 Tax=Williamsoniiplasma somnilux TaxID=215578 RepID=A0A2K8NYC5_9MOLU|nr:ribonuclease Y [Williamsoniiplasma somnilux]ATZ18832.1 ribonuclease Y [Williamsoniiplasma somnilux]